MSVYLLKHKGHQGEDGEKKTGLFDRMVKVYSKVVDWFIQLRWWVVPIYIVACGLILGILGLEVGTELFPQIDSGEFVLRFRPPAGSSYELTRRDGNQVSSRDREGSGDQEHRDHDGLRRPGRSELRHRQHGAVHARAGRWMDAYQIEREERHQARRVPRAAPQSPSRAGGSRGWPSGWSRGAEQEACPRRKRNNKRSDAPSDSSRATSSAR